MQLRIAVLVVLLSVVGAGQAGDLLLVNGRIFTADDERTWAEAVAISGSRIDAVGSNEAVARLREPHTRVIDLEQRTVIPGIVDSHAHLWLGAIAMRGFNLAIPRVYIDPSQEESLRDAIEAHATSRPDDPILFGRVRFGSDVDKTFLDSIVSDRPIVIHEVTEHAYWVNSKVLDLARISREPLPDPDVDRFVVRDSDGEPTGVLRDSAMQLVDAALPVPFEERLRWARDAASFLNRYGITSVTSVTGDLEELAVYAELHARGELTVRTRMAFGRVGVNHRLTSSFLSDLEKARAMESPRWLSTGLIKFFSDGAGTPPLYERDEYRDLVTELDRRGYQIATHTLSPVTSTMVLDTYESLAGVNGERDRRLRIEHGTYIAPADLHRLAENEVIASMQPEICCFADGPAESTNAFRTLLDSGASVVFGSDWPVTFPPDPFSGIQQAVLRARKELFTAPQPTAPPIYVSPQQRLTVEEAVIAYTKDGAFARFAERYTGTIEPGKEADLVVLSQNLFEVPAEAIGGTQAVMTMVSGRIVFDDLR